MSIYGFAFKKPEDVYSKRKVVVLDFKKNNPYLIYEESDKNSLFVSNSFLPVQFIMFKKKTRNLEGNFIVIDTPRNLSENKVKCLDCVYSSGMSMRVTYEGDIDYLMKDNATSKFTKRLLSLYKKDKMYKIVSTRLSSLKHLHKEVTFNSVVSDFIKLCKNNKVDVKKSLEHLAKAITNNKSFDSLKEIGSFVEKLIPKIKKICSKGDMSKSIITFQDIVYFLTDRETALAEDLGNEEIVSQLFEMWNPNPSKRKEIKFSCNKKPLPKNKHISKKKRKKWEEQEHIIPIYICARRKKHKKTLYNPKVIGFNDITIPTLEEGEYNKKQLCKFLGIEKCKVIGGYKNAKIVCRHGEIISVINKENNSFNYIRII
jgi:hypothetical protein